MAAVEQLPEPRGEGELVTGVPAVPAGGAVRLQDAAAVQASQECRLDGTKMGSSRSD